MLYALQWPGFPAHEAQFKTKQDQQAALLLSNSDGRCVACLPAYHMHTREHESFVQCARAHGGPSCGPKLLFVPLQAQADRPIQS
jgi:hypothetical protein